MGGKRSRDKGARGEREAASFLEAHGFPSFRGCQRSGSADSPDVRCEVPGVHIEVKRAERVNVYDAMAQAARDAGDGKVPVVFHRRNHHDWIVFMRAEDWVEFLREWTDWHQPEAAE